MFPPELLDIVAFLACKTKKDTKLVGSGFFVAHKVGSNESLISLVTARHVIEAIKGRTYDDKVWVRVNGVNGGIETIGIEIRRFLFHPTESRVDVAVCAISGTEVDNADFKCVDARTIVTDEEFKKVGIGATLYFPGLFSHHAGESRNVPIVRVGNLAAMPSDKVFTKRKGHIRAYLAEARSIGGLSGSPVFLPSHNLQINGYSAMRFIGLIHGHFDLGDGKPDDMFLTDRNVNMGIAIIIPAGDIVEVLNQPVFANERARVEIQLAACSVHQTEM